MLWVVSFYGKYSMIDGKWLQNEKEAWDGRKKKFTTTNEEMA